MEVVEFSEVLETVEVSEVVDVLEAQPLSRPAIEGFLLYRNNSRSLGSIASPQTA